MRFPFRALVFSVGVTALPTSAHDQWALEVSYAELHRNLPFPDVLLLKLYDVFERRKQSLAV